MNIVVLDGHTLNPGDLSWESLRALGPCTIHDLTPPADVLARSRGAGALLTNKTPLGAEMIAGLPGLRYIGVLATGYNIVDVRAAAAHGVVVTNVPAYSTMSVAQVAFAHIFNLTHRTAQHADAVRGGRWSASEDFCFWDGPLVEVSGLTLGIVGLGRIGSAVARAGAAFGMQVIAADPSLGAGFPPGVRPVSVDELFRASDVVSLHCPLTPATQGLVSRARIALMKQSAILINTSRGPLIDEPALADALNRGAIAGAGLDVLSVEPPPPDNPLLSARNCFVTPHYAWASTAARGRLLDEVTENLRAFLSGKQRNVVSA
ncbi:MAG TPA: D-2-hydroxyacid dehydrogenase [Bacteroidota bacterium]|nr:D-2-hydroxyacid dehydrogenase [Bacteroidota bacterium]